MSERVNPGTLKRIRSERKVDVLELASWLGTSTERVEKFERGQATPTIHQLSRMALAFKVPLYAFKKDALPNLEPIPTDFRKRQPAEADLTPGGLNRLWSSEQIADFTNELLIGLKDDAPPKERLPLSKFDAANAPEVLRRSVDEWVRVRGSVIGAEKSPTLTYLKRLRLYIERHGCLVSFNDAPSDDFLGFYQRFNQRTPFAFVNRKSDTTKSALFTVVHEWAHFLFDAEGVSNPWIANNPIERKCNQFAARFLAPAEDVEAIVQKSWTPSSDVQTLISVVSRQTLLGFRASAIRLQELGYAKRKDVSAAFRSAPSSAKIENELDPPPERSGGNIYSAAGRRLSEVGIFACRVADEAKRRKIVDDIDIVKGLNISVKLQPYVFEMARKRFGAQAD